MRLSNCLSNFLFVENLTFHCFGNCRSNLPVYYRCQPAIHFTTLPYWIDHGAGPNITSTLLVSRTKEHSGVTIVVLLHRCRIGACIHCSNMFFYIRRPDGAIDDQFDGLPWWSTMDFSTVSMVIIIIIQTVQYGCIQRSSNDFKQSTKPSERPWYTTLAVVIDAVVDDNTAFWSSVRVCGSNKL